MTGSQSSGGGGGDPASGSTSNPITRIEATSGRRSRQRLMSSRSGGDRVLFPRRRRPSVVARRVVLLAFVLVGIVLVTLEHRGGMSGPVNDVRMQVLGAVSSVERGLGRAWAPIADSVSWGRRLVHATDDNARLRTEVDQLRMQLRAHETAEAENVRLRSLLGMRDRGRFPDGYTTVATTVIARSPNRIDQSVVIDSGSADGIRPNDPVIDARGLVGRVDAVTSGTATIVLMTNRMEAVSAADADTDASGIIRPSGGSGRPELEMSYVTERVAVSVGDLIITSGWSTGDLHSLYPRGIPIGVVSSVGNEPGDLYKSVQVTPFADFDRIDAMLVVVPGDRAGRQG